LKSLIKKEINMERVKISTKTRSDYVIAKDARKKCRKWSETLDQSTNYWTLKGVVLNHRKEIPY